MTREQLTQLKQLKYLSSGLFVRNSTAEELKREPGKQRRAFHAAELLPQLLVALEAYIVDAEDAEGS